jgi:hypothetical protein
LESASLGKPDVSGIADLVVSTAASDAVRGVLARQVSVPALSALRGAISAHQSLPGSDKTIAFGFDSGVLLRLLRSTEALDYLGGRHQGPLILPAQTVQEFWNNQVAVILTKAASVRRKFDDLDKELRELADEFEEFRDAIHAVLESFEERFGDVYSERTVQGIVGMIEVLQEKCLFSQPARDGFLEMAESRKRTKTPPGFKDAGDGDFFVWVEFLCGLGEVRAADIEFHTAVLLTEDRKADWSQGGRAHPVLAAEVAAVAGVPLEIWDLAKLEVFVAAEVRGVGEPEGDLPPSAPSSADAPDGGL